MLQVSILLPTWLDEARAPLVVRSAWSRYFGQLKAHEEGHKDIARAGAEKLDQLVHGISSLGTCAALEASLNRAAEAVLAEEDRTQQLFEDGQTGFSLFH